ncbi:MAG: hypothetical protein AAFR58_19470 [Cyanobacteria bacterium J06627_28]
MPWSNDAAIGCAPAIANKPEGAGELLFLSLDEEKKGQAGGDGWILLWHMKRKANSGH